MYAIIETGGKQYRVQNGDKIAVEKLNIEDGQQVVFDKVLVVGEGADVKSAHLTWTVLLLKEMLLKQEKARRLLYLSIRPRRTTERNRVTDSRIL